MREIISRLGPQDVIALGIGVALFLVIALAWMLSALAAGFYANRLNRSAAWGLAALVVSPLTVFLLLFGLGPRADEDDDSIRISCPFCAEDIKSEARLCPHCRSDLTRTAAERLRPR
jgi:hypothetical protein